MKRSTLIIIAIAAVLAVGVYYLEVKDAKPRDSAEKPDTTKPAFTFQREDIASITLIRGGETANFEDRDGKWFITDVGAPADSSAVDSIARSVAAAKIEKTVPAEGDLNPFGLNEPAVTLEIKLKNGEQHKIVLGSKDFSNLSVYAKIDDQSDIALLPAAVLTDSDKPLSDLRERSVLGVSQFDVKSLTIQNENGRLELAKDGGDWKLTGPIQGDADSAEVSSLVSEITTAKVSDFVDHPESDLSKYGLDKPKITLTAKLEGGERILSIGSEADGDYYAKTSERTQIFKIGSLLYEKLNIKPASLRSKQIVKVEEDQITQIQIKNPNTKLTAEKKEDNWVVTDPGDKKDKSFESWRVFSPLDTKATEIVDSPSASVKAKVAKPAVEIRLKAKDGKTTVIRVSDKDGEDVYVTVEGRSTVYKVGKDLLERLSFKLNDAVS